MASVSAAFELLRRHVPTEANADEPAEVDHTETCANAEVVLGHMPLRIASVFIILVASLSGALLPILLHRMSRVWGIPSLTLFIFRFVGTGVIIGTAWMHLLSPAIEALHSECLHHRLGEYDWAFFIALMTILIMFLVELIATRLGSDKLGRDPVDGGAAQMPTAFVDEEAGANIPITTAAQNGERFDEKNASGSSSLREDTSGISSAREALPANNIGDPRGNQSRESLTSSQNAVVAGQMVAVSILEFGVVFHSVFIGLALSTAKHLEVLVVVLTFHQFLEGLGLGSRLAVVQWRGGRRWLPYFFALIFGVSAPLAIAIGIGTRPSTAEDQILVNGIFDAISAGILMFTGLVDLIGGEFLYDSAMRGERMSRQLLGYACVVFGAGVMAALAVWA